MRMALLGASVCGKSVTLKCIAGIMTPDRGHIALFPNMTVLQNIRCGIRSGSRAVPARKSAGKRGTRREDDRSVQHPRGQMPVLQVKVK